MHRVLFAAFLTCIGVAFAADNPGVTDAEVRAAITRSLPFIEKEGVAWKEGRKCSSCHEVTFMTWTFNLAQAKGFTVDAAKVDGWNDWCASESLDRRGLKMHDNTYNTFKRGTFPEEVLTKLNTLVGKRFESDKELLAVLTADESAKHGAEIVKIIRNGNVGSSNEHMQQMLLARPARLTEKMAEYVATTPAFIASQQQADGFWKMGGQMPGLKWEKTEGEFVTTAWTVLALASVDNRGAEADGAIEKALAALKAAKPAKTTEALMLALLLEQRFGTAERTAELLAELRKGQNADGGWAWLRGGESDAFTTGQVLYALVRYGAGDVADEIGRGRAYLLKTQEQDGAWSQDPRRMTASTDAGRLKKLEPIHRFWGSAWATMGLLETLPAPEAAKVSATTNGGN